MADRKHREDLKEAYEKYKNAAAALQEEMRLSFDHPGFSFDPVLCLELEKFKYTNQKILTMLEQLGLRFYIGMNAARALSQYLCIKMDAAGVKEQSPQKSEKLKNNEQLRLAIMARPWEHKKAASHEEPTQQEVSHANAPTEETEVAESSDSANKIRSDDTAAPDMASPNPDQDKTA